MNAHLQHGFSLPQRKVPNSMGEQPRWQLEFWISFIFRMLSFTLDWRIGSRTQVAALLTTRNRTSIYEHLATCSGDFIYQTAHPKNNENTL